MRAQARLEVMGGQRVAAIETQRCTATKKNGERCGSVARPGLETCHFHTEGVDPAEIGRKAGLASGASRSVRERFREDAERCYEKLIESMFEAIEAETVKWGDCPNCKHKVPVSFPDIRARTGAIQVLLDQGYGRPKETVEVGVLSEEERRRQLRAEIMKMTPDERRETRVKLVAELIAGMLHDEPTDPQAVRIGNKEELRDRLAAVTSEEQNRLREVLRVTAQRELELIEAGEPLAPPAPTSA